MRLNRVAGGKKLTAGDLFSMKNCDVMKLAICISEENTKLTTR